MGKAANRAKTKWNATNYTQVKVSVDPGIASAFKAACETAGVSMAGKVSQFMAGYGTAAVKRKPASSGDTSTRRKRRGAVAEIIARMKDIRDAEAFSHGNVPENLTGADAYETTEDIISAIEEAIELLESIY